MYALTYSTSSDLRWIVRGAECMCRLCWWFKLRPACTQGLPLVASSNTKLTQITGSERGNFSPEKRTHRLRLPSDLHVYASHSFRQASGPGRTALIAARPARRRRKKVRRRWYCVRLGTRTSVPFDLASDIFSKWTW
jgi:hypothetical protein